MCFAHLNRHLRLRACAYARGQGWRWVDLRWVAFELGIQIQAVAQVRAGPRVSVARRANVHGIVERTGTGIRTKDEKDARSWTIHSWRS